MQREDRALRRRKIAAALDPLGTPEISLIACLIATCLAGLDHLEQAAADDVDRSRQQILQLLTREIVALADRERQNAVLAGALDQRRISGLRKLAPALPAARLTDLAVAAAHNDIGEVGRKLWPLRHRQQMTLALDAGDLDQACSSITGDRRSSGPAIDISSSRASCPTSPRGALARTRQPLGQIGARGKFGVRNEIDQNAVEQINMIGPETRGPQQEQFGDPARGFGQAFGVALV